MHASREKGHHDFFVLSFINKKWLVHYKKNAEYGRKESDGINLADNQLPLNFFV